MPTIPVCSTVLLAKIAPAWLPRLILSALDVPRETIIEDYMLTRKHYDSTRADRDY